MWFIACAIIFLLRKREVSEEIISHGTAGLAKVTMNITVTVEPKNLYVLSPFFNNQVDLWSLIQYTVTEHHYI